jgi:hypothetical protein
LKAGLARQINAEIAEKDLELEHALRKMGLVTGVIAERNVEIPPEVFQKGTFLRDPTKGMVSVEATLVENLRRGKLAGDAVRALLEEVVAAGRGVPPALKEAVEQVQQSIQQACRLDQEVGKIYQAIKPNLTLLAGTYFVDNISGYVRGMLQRSTRTALLSTPPCSGRLVARLIQLLTITFLFTLLYHTRPTQAQWTTSGTRSRSTRKTARLQSRLLSMLRLLPGWKNS